MIVKLIFVCDFPLKWLQYFSSQSGLFNYNI